MPRVPILKDIVRLSLLERVSPDYLVRFLRLYQDYLGTKDVLLDDVEVNERWIGHLYGVLTACDPAMPAGLQQALLDVAELASDDAHEQLLELAGERQLSLFRTDDCQRLSPYDLAFKVYLEQRDLFGAAHARALVREARRFVEFLAPRPGCLKGAISEGKRAILCSRLGRWFAERNCTSFCDVRIDERCGEVTFLVIHGRAPRSTSIIQNESERSRLSFVPDGQDTVIFDTATGRLSVEARWPVEQDVYRRLVGEVFFDDGTHFATHELYSGEPLVEDGREALSVSGIPGLVGVTLKKVEVHPPLDQSERFVWSGVDLGSKLGTEEARFVLAGRVVSYLKLSLALRGHPRQIPVEIRPPNKVTYDRRVGEVVVREFLLARRFMRLPDVRCRRDNYHAAVPALAEAP
ncbi:MAG: hypothetical protein V2A73_22300 [Pseudomonadota bacterium]